MSTFTVAEAISSVRTVLEKSRVSKDSRIKDSFILSEINDYRAIAISEKLDRSQSIDSTVIQNMGEVKMSAVSSSDDPNVLDSKTTFGKAFVPAIIQMTSDKGAYSVRTLSGEKAYIPTEYNKFWEIPKTGHIASCFNYFFRLGNAFYIHPYKSATKMLLILANPMDGFVVDNTVQRSGSLILATNYNAAAVYEVISGTVLHNGIIQTKGSTFTAVNKTYTGQGVVKFASQKRPMTFEDPYPMPRNMMEVIKTKIWKITFGLEKTEIADIKNDSTDQVHLLQDER